MAQGVFALLGRSLRVDARSLPTHLGRLAMMAAIYCLLIGTLSLQGLVGAPGLRFFQGIAYVELASMTLLGLGYFSSTIVEEKEEDTLGLMLMAGISPLGILAGKCGGRLWQAMLLIAIQYPLTLLAVTMGGLTGTQVFDVTLTLLAYLMLLAGFGLFCSTVARGSRSATSLMITGLAVYFVAPLLVRLLYPALLARRTSLGTEICLLLFSGIDQTSVVNQLDQILSTGYSGSSWNWQVIGNSTLGLVFASLSWWLFDYVTHSPSTDPSSRGLVARRGTVSPFSAGRVRGNPFLWKDFHFVAGGLGMMLVRAVFYLGVIAFVSGVDRLQRSPSNSWIDPCLLLLSISVAADAGWVLARALQDEIRGQSLAALILLPRSSTSVLYAKFAGALLGWLPGPLIELALTFLTETGRRDFLWFAKNPDGIAWMVVAFHLLIPHLAACLSLFMRWGAVPLAVGLCFGGYLGSAFVMNWIGPFPDRSAAIVITLFVLMLCGIGHLAVLLRIQTLAAR